MQKTKKSVSTKSVSTKNKVKNKMSLWQRVGAYVLIGGAAYSAIYLYYANNGGMAYAPTTSTVVAQATPIVNPNAPLISTKVDAKKASYLVAANGMTLYSSDKDGKSKSNCEGACAVVWPAYLVTPTSVKLAANLTTFKRADGAMQYAYMGKPLYYFMLDKQAGDMQGTTVGGVWRVVTP